MRAPTLLVYFVEALRAQGRIKGLRQFLFNRDDSILITKRDFTVEKSLEFVVSNTNIMIGRGTRVCKGSRFYLKGGSVQIGEECFIGDLVDISASRSVWLGKKVTLGRLTHIQSDVAPLEVGDESSVGQGSHLWAHTGKIQIGACNSIGKNTNWIGTGGGISIAAKCDFGHNVTLDSAGGSIDIAEGSGVGPSSVLYGHGGLQIGRGCAIAGLTMLVPANHVFANRSIPLREQGVRLMPIVVGDDVWIGSGVTVLGNTNIGNGAVVGAGAVVVGGNVEHGRVVVGIPARPT